MSEILSLRIKLMQQYQSVVKKRMEGLISLSIFLKRQEVGLFIGKRGEFN